MKLRFEIELNRPRIQVHRRFFWFEIGLLVLILVLTGVVSRVRADMGTCSGQTLTLAFNDVAGNPFFCFIAEIYFLGITAGCGDGTAYCPNDNVSRQQMAVFLDRTHDSALKRGSQRAALGQWWTTTPHYTSNNFPGTTAVGSSPVFVQSDGADLWVVNTGDQTLSRVRASDGKVLETRTLGQNGEPAFAPLVARGYVFVTGTLSDQFVHSPGLFYINPATLSSTRFLGISTPTPRGLAFDGSNIWTANNGTGPGTGALTLVNLDTLGSIAYSAGFSEPEGILYDGANLWVTDIGDNYLKKVDPATGQVILSVSVGGNPKFPVFDGTNIWVPSYNDNMVSVVRASTGAVLATLTGNGLNNPFQAAFDGQRVLVTNPNSNSVSLWKAADFTPLGSVSTGAGTGPFGACSDGLNFWITLSNTGKLARF